jgi:protein required for attachment to host cells
MKKTWVVLANAGRARIFERESEDGALVELLDLVHPQSREKAGELASDREGHAQKAHGDPGHAGTAFQPHTTLREKEHAAFAVEVSRHLEVAATQGRCGDVALIASDPFLGELKSHLGDATKRVLSAAIPRDLTIFSGTDLAHRITEALVQVRYG